MPTLTRARYRKRFGVLRNKRSTFIEHYRDLSRHILPRRARFDGDKKDDGSKRHQSIVNNIATRALRVLGSGMMAGITSPARRWFRLTVPDQTLARRRTVRVWLDEVERRILMAFARSNIYASLPVCYEDLGTYGISPMAVEADFEDILRTEIWPVGSYCIAMDHRNRVNTVYRDVSLTAEQLARRFGEKDDAKGNGLSNRVKELLANGDLDTEVDCVQVIETNDDFSVGMSDLSGKKFRAVWYETKGDEGKLLGVEGFEEFPVMVPRWSVTGNDSYATSPGMDALGDIRQLQFMEKRRGEGIDKMVRPPMRGPTSLRRKRKSIVAGAVTYVDGVGQRGTFEPSVEVDARILQLENELARFESRIAATFHADLFLMMTSTNIPQMTAREVEERHQEKMLQLGPVLERLHKELLDPLIDRVFGIMLRAGLLPEAPAELGGVDLRVEYLGILAQAQKLIGTVGVERLFQFGTQLSEFNPFVLDVLDFDKAMHEYGQLLGTAAELLKSPEDVLQLRQQRAAQEQAKQAAELAQAGAGAARDLAGADLSNDTALSRMLSAMPGGAARRPAQAPGRAPVPLGMAA